MFRVNVHHNLMQIAKREYRRMLFLRHHISGAPTMIMVGHPDLKVHSKSSPVVMEMAWKAHLSALPCDKEILEDFI